jgi:chromosome partitioning protein
MLMHANQSGSAHVVVLGGEKGGSGKTTAAMHIAIALMKAGQRVATIDLDCRQQTFTRYINNRRAWARRIGLDLKIPAHTCIRYGETMQVADNESSELEQFMDAVGTVERALDFIVIDTPGSDSYLMRLAHAMADTLVTPINDSFLDFDVLGTVDAATYSVTGESHYAKMVRDIRRQRRRFDGAITDWIVARNRLSPSLRATSSWSPMASANCHFGSAFARSTALPNVKSTASFFHAG